MAAMDLTLPTTAVHYSLSGGTINITDPVSGTPMVVPVRRLGR